MHSRSFHTGKRLSLLLVLAQSDCGMPRLCAPSEGRDEPLLWVQADDIAGQTSNARPEEQVSSGVSSETVLTKSEKPSKSLARWRYEMAMPVDGRDPEKLWVFVGAHVEDRWRKNPCPLAEKAWKLLTIKVMVGYKARGRAGLGGLPSAMPGRLASWRGQGKDDKVEWSEKYVDSGEVGLRVDNVANGWDP